MVYRKIVDKINFVLIAIGVLLLYGCNQHKKHTQAEVRLCASIENVLKMYIQENPEYDSFLLLTEINDLPQYSNASVKCFVIGPAYKGLYNSGESSYMSYPSIYALIDKRNVFIQSSLDPIVKNKDIRRLYQLKEQKTQNEVSEFPIEYYMKHAMAFWYDIGSDSIYDISRRADTVMLKQRAEFVPPQVKWLP